MKIIKNISLFLALIIVLSFPITNAEKKQENGNKNTLLKGLAETVEGTEQDIKIDYQSKEQMIEDMVLISKNNEYQMYLHENSLSIGIKDLKSNDIHITSPYNTEQHSSGDITQQITSQVTLEYVDKDHSIKKLLSSKDCVSKGQYNYSIYENGLLVNMTVGEDTGKQMAPQAMSTKRYEDITSKLKGRQLARMESLYSLYSSSNFEDDQEELQRLIKLYPLLEKEDIYICVELNDRDKRDIDSYLSDIGYKSQDYTELLNEVGISQESQVAEVFEISIEYVLDKDGMTVRIPNESISYDKENLELLSIHMLEYFASDVSLEKAQAENGKEENNNEQPEQEKSEETQIDDAKTEQPKDETENKSQKEEQNKDNVNDGYILIPDGSGALVSLNNQPESRRSVMTGRVFGRDLATKTLVDDRENSQYHLPVFGIRTNSNTAIFANVIAGAEMCEIITDLGSKSDYYSVSANFIYKDKESVEIDAKVESVNSKSTIIVTSPIEYDKDYIIRYSFRSGNKANYFEMANIYKTYLEGLGLKKNKNSNKVHFGIETLGTSRYDETFLGFAYNAEAKYTTYEQSKEIAKWFKENGISDINLVLKGWQKDGLDEGVANKVRVSSALGGKKQLDELNKWTDSNGITLYPDVDMLLVTRDRMFDGFSVSSDGTRRLDKKYAGKPKFHADIYNFKGLSPAISPIRYQKYWDKFFKQYEKLNIKNISLGSAGEYLTSNFKTSDALHRGTSLKSLVSQIDIYSKHCNIAFNGANAYTLPYASTIKNVPTSSSGFIGQTHEIPFLQLVLANNISYHSTAINLYGNQKLALLKCIESRTSPYFTVAADNVSRLKSTDHTRYFSVGFDVLKKSILDSYNYVMQALQDVQGVEIISHEVVAKDIYCTTYKNGIKIYVNYSDSDFKDEYITVKAMDYLKI